LWAVAIPIAALAARHADASTSAANLLALVVYELGSIVCHQRPERSFHLASVPLPVCARCTGIYAGAAFASAVAWLPWRGGLGLFPAGPEGERSRRHSAAGTTSVLLAAAAPALLTLVYEWVGSRMPSNEVRALTGVVLGAAVAWVLTRLE
jgi:uncharacterized membrane protein